MQPFVYNALPARVLFGYGTLKQLRSEIERLGCKRALILTTPFQESIGKDIEVQIGSLSAGVFSGATMHTPSEVTETALEEVKKASADCVVSIGGGSTIGLGKAIALRTDLPQIVVPTTYAGSEATPIM